LRDLPIQGVPVWLKVQVARWRCSGVEAAADTADVRSPETYIGADRAEGFVSPGGAKQDQVRDYTAPTAFALNQWALTGDWRVGGQDAVLAQPDGGITYRFRARDLHLVLGPGTDGKPVRFQVLIDGHSPGDNHGVDTDGNGVIIGQRLYQLVRLAGEVSDHTFQIRFLDAGATAYSFTFGSTLYELRSSSASGSLSQSGSG
jgi:hypothetical protein